MSSAVTWAEGVTTPRRSYGGGKLLAFTRAQPLGAFGAVLIVLLAFLAVAGPLITPEDPNAVSTDVLKSPSSEHWFGTDNFGRDYFSRIIAGARVSISIALAAITIGVTGGVLLGMASAYAGGVTDLCLQRVIDAMLALPSLILAMFFVSIFGSSVGNLILVLSITIVPPVSRVARGSSLGILAEPYIDAGRVIGVPAPRLLLRYILPNIAAPIVVIITTGIGALILAEAGLSFLGMGIPPPTAEWGGMLSQSRAFALDAPWLAIFPGAAISIAVLAFNLFGDAMRDVWDPRLRIG
jgi:peptide/nickel transport system permease protein